MRTGERTPLAEVATRVLRALSGGDLPYAVIGATALAARGLPRHTADLDVVVTFDAIVALEREGFRSTTPVDKDTDPEPMYILTARGVEVDLLVASGEPESTVIAEATSASVFGMDGPVATLEHLLLMYLYSPQPRHIGDFASIVVTGRANLAEVERHLSDVHPEMLGVFRDRVRAVLHPPPSPERPKRRRGRSR